MTRSCQAFDWFSVLIILILLEQLHQKYFMSVKMSIDPFEIATNDYDTPPDSPHGIETTTDAGNEEDALKGDIKTNNKGDISPTATPINSDAEDDDVVSQPPLLQNAAASEEPPKSKEEEEENMDVELGKYQSGDPDKIEKFTTVLAQLTPDQMNRYESFRRAGFQKANMRRVLQSIAGCPISLPMTIVMSGVAKMFVGELVETARMVMTERNERGPIRPCHMREAYRRLKLEGKVPTRSRPRRFY